MLLSLSCKSLPCCLQLGGIGFVHYNMPLDKQVQTVQKVKQQAVGFAANPFVTMPQDLQVHCLNLGDLPQQWKMLNLVCDLNCL